MHSFEGQQKCPGHCVNRVGRACGFGASVEPTRSYVLNLCRLFLPTVPQAYAGQARTEEQQRGGLRYCAEVGVKAHHASPREVYRGLRVQRLGSGMYKAF